jgi:NTE family protein
MSSMAMSIVRSFSSNALGFYQIGEVSEFAESRKPQSATAALMIKTVAGPIFFGSSFGDAAHRRWYFGMGRVF